MKLIIARGLPGAGKNYYFNQLKKERYETFEFSADDYFVDENGNYKFDVTKIGEAHRTCQEKFLNFMIVHHNKKEYNMEWWDNARIGILNTNTSLWEMAYYIGLANVYNVPFELIWFKCSPETSMKRNVHNVPEKLPQARV